MSSVSNSKVTDNQIYANIMVLFDVMARAAVPDNGKPRVTSVGGVSLCVPIRRRPVPGIMITLG